VWYTALGLQCCASSAQPGVQLACMAAIMLLHDCVRSVTYCVCCHLVAFLCLLKNPELRTLVYLSLLCRPWGAWRPLMCAR
jgi:hypothetical protein